LLQQRVLQCCSHCDHDIFCLNGDDCDHLDRFDNGGFLCFCVLDDKRTNSSHCNSGCWGVFVYIHFDCNHLCAMQLEQSTVAVPRWLHLQFHYCFRMRVEHHDVDCLDDAGFH